MPTRLASGKCIDVAAIRAMFAGGGTGGHLFPAIAIADELKRIEPTVEILFVGTKDKIESRIVPQKGYALQTIWISGFHRGVRLRNLLFPFKLIVSMIQARSIIEKFKPDVVIGTGGYVSGPVLRAATMANVPTLIQEQNSYPGVTTRALASKVHEVHLTFENSKKFFSRTDNLFVSGNPTRYDLDNVDRNSALRFFDFQHSDSSYTLLVFGGSLGAHSINEAVEKSLGQLMQQNIRLIWQTGAEDFPAAREAVEQTSSTRIWVQPFIDRMDYAYAASDIVVCRAGATTISELTRLGKPAILVPYPHAAANHQVENALSVANAGAAEIIYDHEVFQKLFTSVMSLCNKEKLHSMSEQSKKLGKPDAAHTIARRAVDLAMVYNRRKR